MLTIRGVGSSGKTSARHAPWLFGAQSMVRASRRALGAQPVTIVMYHSISNDAHEYAITPETFARQIRILSDTYPIMRLEEVEAALAKRSNRRHLVISFDDAYTDFIEHAYPILEALKVPCTLFVPTGHIGGWNEWDSGVGGLPKARIMDARQLSKIAESGLVDLGAHTVDHLSMRGLPVPEMRRQAFESRQSLEALLGRPVATFSYPYGGLDDYSGITTRVLAESGYKAAVTTRWGTSNSLRNILALRRIFFRESDSEADMRAKVEGQYDWLAAKERAGFMSRCLRRHIPRTRS